MTGASPATEIEIVIPAELDAATAPDAYARLLAALEQVENDGARACIDLTSPNDTTPGPDGVTAPLAHQLIVSAARTFPAETVRFGDRARAVLSTNPPSKELDS